MAITFFGVASTPADGAATTNTSDPTVITPPGSMVAGDLVIVYAAKRTASGTISVSQASGQTWSSFTTFVSTSATLAGNLFWCRFNGTWTPANNPSFSFSATTNNTAVMIVFRPTSGSNTWAYDDYSVNNPNLANQAAAATFTVSAPIPQIPNHNSNVTISIMNTDDDNTWGTLTGAGWSKTNLSAQYRNTSGSDTSITFAYLIQTTAASIPDTTQTQLTLGNDGGIIGVATWYEITAVAAIPNKIYQINQAINRSNTY